MNAALCDFSIYGALEKHLLTYLHWTILKAVLTASDLGATLSLLHRLNASWSKDIHKLLFTSAAALFH